jgi:endo-1,4-beta-xylanase
MFLIRMNTCLPILYLALLTLTAGLNAFAQPAAYTVLWNNPAVQGRISEGIEKHRKGGVHIRFTDSKGEPLSGVNYEIVQTGHDFLFGANIFMLQGFEQAGENKQFEENFLKLFNYASAPFYWKTLEPQPDQLRFVATSQQIYRRPPPDLVLDFCRKHHLTIKGHTLVWEHPVHSMPDWLPKDTAAIEKLIDKRMQEIAARYSSQIKIWDVVNEALKLHPGVIMPKDYVFKSFKQAEKLFPGSQLLINEVTSQSWDNLQHENSPYYLQIQNLLQRGAKIDGIGLQFHFFSEDYHNRVVAGEAMQPQTMYRALDLLSDFKKPLHVTEITIPTLPATTEGEAIQATLTENFYRLWFSHPAVEAITWWNTVDETAVPGEDKWKGGLLGRDFSPKPSFTVLNNLINKEWRTNITGKTKESELDFRGFYGKYRVKIRKGNKVTEKEIHVSKGTENEFTIEL